MPRMTFMQRVRAVRDREDAGAIAVLVTILLAGGVLLGMAALTIDVGALYSERRQLQNSSDAGALSLAQDCSVNAAACNTSGASIASLVDDNDTSDGTTAIAGICIHRDGGSTGQCTGGGGLTDCLAVPSGIDNYVEVRTSTRTSSGGTLLPPFFAQALVGGYSGTTVGACSRAAWGSPGGASTIPLTISNCEFNYYVGNPPQYGPPPPYPSITSVPWPYAGAEHVIFFHNTAGNVAACPPGPAGSDDPISGGFGWLQSTNCVVTTDTTDWFDASPGTSPGSDCRASDLAASYGQLVHVPIYDGTNGLNGANGTYHIKGYAAFVLTGYYLGGSYKKKSLITLDFPCGRDPTHGDERCISGFFTQDLEPTDDPLGGPPMGVPAIQLIG